MVAIDANFKLKLKSHGYRDVELAAGYAYFVCGAPYQEILDAHRDEEEDVRALFFFSLVNLSNNIPRPFIAMTWHLDQRMRLNFSCR